VAEPATDRLAVQSERPPDACQGFAGRVAGADLLPTGDSAFAGSHAALLRPTRWRWCHRRGRTWVGRRLACGRVRLDLEPPRAPAEQFVQRGTGIVQQVKAVGDLHGVGRTRARAFGVGSRPVAGDDLHAGVRLQPGSYHLGGALGEQVDGTVSL